MNWLDVFAGVLGALVIRDIANAIAEYYESRKRKKALRLLLEEMEDFEADDDDDF